MSSSSDEESSDESDASQPPPSKKARYHSPSAANTNVLVGPNEYKFVVHEKIITRHSTFFKAACSGEWKEAKEKVVRLPETSVQEFGTYLAWLYTGNVDVTSDADDSDEATSDSDEDESSSSESSSKPTPFTTSILRFVDCDILADMLGDQRYSNAIMDALLQLTNDSTALPALSTVRRMWESLPSKSKIRMFLVDHISTESVAANFVANGHEYPQSFMVEVAIAWVKESDVSKEDRMPRNRPKCFYHHHKDDADKCA